jgi:hypothetical protein
LPTLGYSAKCRVVSVVRIIGKISLTVALIGGCVGFTSQWMMFHTGNFSVWGGEVFIPMLGLYTTRRLGTAWYVGGASFLVGGLLWLVTAVIDRKASR